MCRLTFCVGWEMSGVGWKSDQEKKKKWSGTKGKRTIDVHVQGILFESIGRVKQNEKKEGLDGSGWIWWHHSISQPSQLLAISVYSLRVSFLFVSLGKRQKAK